MNKKNNKIQGDTMCVKIDTDSLTLNSEFEEQKKPSSLDEEMDGKDLNGVCLIMDKSVNGILSLLKKEFISFSNINDISQADIIQAFEACYDKKVIFLHNSRSSKIDQRIVKIATKLKKLDSSVELYQLDINAEISDARSLKKAIKPFSLYEYKRGENIGFFDNGNGINLKTFDQVDQAKIKPIEWYVKGILPKIGSVQLAAEPKTGKSVIAEQLAYCFSYGLDFWNSKLPQCEVLLYDLEESVEDLNKRIQGFNEFYKPEAKPENVYIRNAINQFIPEQKGDLTIFDDLNDELLDHPNIKVIIIDNIKSTLLYSDSRTRSENKSEHDLLQKLNKWAGDNKILLIFTNHVTKETISKENPFKSIEGTNSMAGGPKINMVLCKDQAVQDKLILFGESRISRPFEYDLFRESFLRPTKDDPNNDDVVFRLEERDIKQYPIDKRVLEACQKLLNDNGGNEVKTTSGEIMKLINNPSGLTKTKMTNTIKRLGGRVFVEEYNLNIFLTSNGTGGAIWHITQLNHQ